MNRTYKNASVIMAGLACLLVVSEIILRFFTNSMDFDEEIKFWSAINPMRSLATPILFAWIGILLRKRFPAPKCWVKWILLAIIPATYVLWTILHQRNIYWWGDGERCLFLYSGILGYLIPNKYLEDCAGKKGWLELVLFLASAFCYYGVTRVENHFSVANFQMLTGEWTRLFCRLMRFTPMAMSLFFLAQFSFSQIGQSVGSKKAIGWIVQGLTVISFIMVYSWTTSWWPSRYNLFKWYKILSQPFMIQLLCGFARMFKKGRAWLFLDLFFASKQEPNGNANSDNN